MFDETRKYKNNSHFFFKKGNRLSEVSKNVSELSGVYYFIRFSKSRINNKQDGMKRQDFFDKK